MCDNRRQWCYRSMYLLGGALLITPSKRAFGADNQIFDPVPRNRLDPVPPDPITINPVDEDATERDVTELDGPVVDLQKQLETGLMARRDKEFAFIRRVVIMVQNDQLSAELVKGTFQWARTKRPYPFPYFQKALRARAAREGVRII